MDLKGNTILITGGATGIGFALAERFLSLGNNVIICGRRENKLNEAKEKLPELHTIRCDISKEAERVALFDKISSEFKKTNILVNNAGIQRSIDFRKGVADLLKNEDEIEINLRSQIYLAARFIPFLMKQANPAIVNVSSGLGFIPLTIFPIYSATKAAIHSFSLSLRHQLRETSIKVFEVIPPTVYDTELKGKPIEKTDWTISSSVMADAVVAGLKDDKYVISAGAAVGWVKATEEERNEIFRNINH